MKTLLFALTATLLMLAACEPVPTETVEDDTSMPTELEEEVVTESNGVNYVEFDQAAYDAALAEGQTVFLNFHADWCPTCRANEPKIRAALDDAMIGPLAAFEVDYDHSDELQQQFEIRSQSTMVLVRGGDVNNFVVLGPALVSEDDVANFLES